MSRMLNFLLLVVYITAVASSNQRDRPYYEEKFYNWLSFFKLSPPTGTFRRIYSNQSYQLLSTKLRHCISILPGMHYVRWLQNFANNDDIITAHNLKKLSYTLGHNQFSHLTKDQWRDVVHFGLDRATADSG